MDIRASTDTVKIRINGQETPFNVSGISKVTDLIELIKAVIDPDHMISAFLLNGKELQDHEWNGMLAQLGTATFEVETSTPENYVGSRLMQAPELASTCYFQFRESRKLFQEGKTIDANKNLVLAVSTLKEFFTWYATIIELLTPERRKLVELDEQMNGITEVCKKICQQQLYQSWWALGESIKNELEPKLDSLEDACKKALATFDASSITGSN